MRRLLLFTLLFFYLFTNAQTVKGKIVDSNKNPIAGANVYFDGTTLAVISNENGYFELNSKSKMSAILVVSYVGFQTEYLTDFDGKDLLVILKEATNQLEEVVISKDKFSRAEKIKLFKQQFLGKKASDKNLSIENVDDVRFSYDASTYTIQAFSNKPLIIYNRYLGYKITYDLVNFEVNFHRFGLNVIDINRAYYAGTSRFEEIENNEKTIKRRELVYLGSNLHFFRNLASKKWDKDNFLLFPDKLADDPNKYFIVSDTLDIKKVRVIKPNQKFPSKKFKASFNLLYKKKEQSKITFEVDTFFIDQFGNNSNFESILFTGKLAEDKIGELLPLDYGIDLGANKKTP
jgi:CarboxypepD_reg-like domain